MSRTRTRALVRAYRRWLDRTHPSTNRQPCPLCGAHVTGDRQAHHQRRHARDAARASRRRLEVVR